MILDMKTSKRPVCIGMHGMEDDCQVCEWQRECKEMVEDIDSALTRNGNHVRIVSKYKEKKYKPKRI